MFFLFFLLWIIFNGRITVELAVIGALISAALYAFVCCFLGYSPRKDLAVLKKIGVFLRYGTRLIREIWFANITVLGYILSSRYVVEPRLVSFRTRLKTDSMRALLANSITLTPGTITARLEGDLLTVHCLDGELSEGLRDSEIERILLEAEGGDEQ